MANRALRVLMVSSEVESLARTGGLGDVVDALSVALADLGLDVLVVTPLYGVTRLPKSTRRWPSPVPVRHGWGPDDVRAVGVVELDEARFASGGVRRVCLVDDPALFRNRAGIYADAGGTFGDNALRFAVMSRGALEIADRVWPGEGPDVLHAHDWHAAFATIYARAVMGDRWKAKASVFTIHNLAYQGVLDEGALDRLHLPRELYNPFVLWHEHNVNLMKGATALADRITTVSPTYAKEILTPENGFGLDGHLRAHAARLRGIVNGIDVARFDPKTDLALASRYDASSFPNGRAACRAALAKEAGIDPGDGPIFGAVTRLTWQKGIDLLLPLFGEIVESGGSIVVVGQGETELEAQLLDAMDHHAGRVCVRIAFDPPLSRRIYAGSDFFLMPSRFEPCGLTQMYAMRYGALPIVTDVGGLHDTVTPMGRGDVGTGFVAAYPGIEALRLAVDAALELHGDRGAHARAVARAMSEDFSWASPARAYRALYEELVAG
jgi:starch synthase